MNSMKENESMNESKVCSNVKFIDGKDNMKTVNF